MRGPKLKWKKRLTQSTIVWSLCNLNSLISLQLKLKLKLNCHWKNTNDMVDNSSCLHSAYQVSLEFGPTLTPSFYPHPTYYRCHQPGQLVLRQSHVLIIGVGGLGCPVLLYLAASGIGEITILDHDKVELSNLGRQILHTEQGARDGLSKVASGKRAVKALNSNVKVNAYQVAFTPELFSPSPNDGLASIFNEDPKFDLILDCTDNPATRHLINAYSVKWGIPLVSGGAVRADGVVGVYGLDLKGKGEERQDGEEEKGPCYACVFPPTASTCSSEARGTESQEARERREEQEALLGTGSCSDEGVLGVLCGTVGLGMAGEALKVLLGKGSFPKRSPRHLMNWPIKKWLNSQTYTSSAFTLIPINPIPNN